MAAVEGDDFEMPAAAYHAPADRGGVHETTDAAAVQRGEVEGLESEANASATDVLGENTRDQRRRSALADDACLSRHSRVGEHLSPPRWCCLLS